MTHTQVPTRTCTHTCTDAVRIDKHTTYIEAHADTYATGNTGLHTQAQTRTEPHTYVLPSHVGLGPLPPRIGPACCHSRLLLQ